MLSRKTKWMLMPCLKFEDADFYSSAVHLVIFVFYLMFTLILNVITVASSKIWDYLDLLVRWSSPKQVVPFFFNLSYLVPNDYKDYFPNVYIYLIVCCKLYLLQTSALDGETDLKSRVIPSLCMGIDVELLHKIKARLYMFLLMTDLLPAIRVILFSIFCRV